MRKEVYPRVKEQGALGGGNLPSFFEAKGKKMVRLAGLEPALLAPEASALSTEL